MSELGLKRRCRFTPVYAAAPLRALMPAPAMRAAISAYIGDGNEFDKAIAAFAWLTPTRANRDWRIFLDAIKAGRITTQEPRSST